MTTTTATKFDQARALFPHTERVIYFNSASYGPFCKPVRDTIAANLDQRMWAEEDDSHDAFSTADQLREDFAGLIGTAKRSVGLGLNTSFGLNIAAFGLPLKEGDEVLMSDVEFPAIPYVWRAASEQRGLKPTYLKSKNRFFDVAELEQHITDKSRVLSVSWVQFFNGYKNDLQELAALCKKHNMYFVVDGIQGMGVEPVDVVKLGIDVFTSGCQKWMLAPQGCGFFYLSDRVRDQITPPFMSWLGVDWQMNFNDLFYFDREYFDSARRFELGYYAVLNILGMKAAVQIFQDLGIADIQQHNHALIDKLAAYVDNSGYYTITSSMEPNHRSSIFTFTCDDVETLHKELLKHKMILVQREGSIRVSIHLFNDEEDIDRLIEVLETFAKGK
ncbi:aminotransferase class V-fold PLP-dependent enzyme [candidate division GN15 bacterium]|nr:aminotransferase class V-fold PLP-dependent enzyme [candidate division GN15 bacterium]